MLVAMQFALQANTIASSKRIIPLLSISHSLLIHFFLKNDTPLNRLIFKIIVQKSFVPIEGAFPAG
jgi:hypothetical protein